MHLILGTGRAQRWLICSLGAERVECGSRADQVGRVAAVLAARQGPHIAGRADWRAGVDGDCKQGASLMRLLIVLHVLIYFQHIGQSVSGHSSWQACRPMIIDGTVLGKSAA